MKWLKRWLMLVGIIQFSAIAAVFMPKMWMDACSQIMGVAPLEDTPIAGYLARLSSAMYVVHGMLLMCVARGLPGQLPVVRAFSSSTAALGTMMLWIDVVEGMPNAWTASECIALLGSAAVMELLLHRAHREQNAHPSESSLPPS
jgi:hypothetical protein